ncbi:MAG: LuxR C-terminal-related transcriptional regulator [Cyanobacteriota bacterium]
MPPISLFESLLDGILIATENELIIANDAARQICKTLLYRVQSERRSPLQVPSEIWQMCQLVTTGHPPNLTVQDGEYYVEPRQQIRMRSRWMTLAEGDRPYLLVILEDQDSLRRRAAHAEAHRFRFTRRETEIWELHRAGHSRQEIAEICYITLETVKKHLKSARAKMELWEEAS